MPKRAVRIIRIGSRDEVKTGIRQADIVVLFLNYSRPFHCLLFFEDQSLADQIAQLGDFRHVRPMVLRLPRSNYQMTVAALAAHLEVEDLSARPALAD